MALQSEQAAGAASISLQLQPWRRTELEAADALLIMASTDSAETDTLEGPGQPLQETGPAFAVADGIVDHVFPCQATPVKPRPRRSAVRRPEKVASGLQPAVNDSGKEAANEESAVPSSEASPSRKQAKNTAERKSMRRRPVDMVDLGNHRESFQ